MRTLFVLDPADDVAAKHSQTLSQRVAAGKSGLIAVEGLHFQILEFGPTFTYYGRTSERPVLLEGCRITRVIIKDDGESDAPARGVYGRGRCTAFVSAPKEGAWELTLQHNTLRAANELYDAIRAGGIKPRSGHRDLR